MSNTNHPILPVTEADLPTLADFLYASKLQLAINRFLVKDWPDEPAQRQICAGAVESSSKDPQATLLKAIDDSSGQVVAHLVLTRRKGEQAQVPVGDGDGNQNQPSVYDPRVFSEVMRMVKEVNMAVEGIDHLEVTHIYVKPSSRKQGIGSQLLRKAFDQAKAAGVPLAVSSEPAAHDFFMKQGFQDTKHAQVDLGIWAPPNCGWGLFRLSGMKLSTA